MTESKLKTAIVVGSTGLIGRHLVKKLLNDSRYGTVKTFSRRSAEISHPKLEENIVDFGLIEQWGDKVCGDELYSALGTTIKNAGSKEKQYLVDYTYQYETAHAAAVNQVEKLLLVSSAGANRYSLNFYLRIKGLLESAVSEMPFKRIIIFQPSLLIGERETPRFTENMTGIIMNSTLKYIPGIKKLRPIKAETVAEAMLNAANDSAYEQLIIYKSDQIFRIAE